MVDIDLDDLTDDEIDKYYAEGRRLAEENLLRLERSRARRPRENRHKSEPGEEPFNIAHDVLEHVEDIETGALIVNHLSFHLKHAGDAIGAAILFRAWEILHFYVRGR